MKLYIVIFNSGFYDKQPNEVIGIFSTEKLADRYINSDIESRKNNCNWEIIKEYYKIIEKNLDEIKFK